MALTVLAACSENASVTDPEPPGPGPGDPVAGAFTLTTVNTQPVPYPIFDDSGYRLDLSASSLALLTGGDFVLVLTTVETVAGFPSTYVDTTRGRWQQATGNVALEAEGGANAAATWDGRQLGFQLTYDGIPLAVIYRRAP